MGNNVSVDAFDPTHVRIYKNIVSLKNPEVRLQMIQTCLMSPEYIMAAKQAGIYSYLLGHIAAIQSGHQPHALPTDAFIQHRHNAQSPQYLKPSNQILPSPVIQTKNSTGYGHNQQQQQLAIHKQQPESVWTNITQTPKNKIISYFSSCLEVLGIQEEVALTVDSLKIAYKKAALHAHPDKGGSEEHFEAVTRAYAYLSEILMRIQGGRGQPSEGTVAVPSAIQTVRGADAEQWKHAEPVRLDPKNLNMDTFNKLFVEMKEHLPDPDGDGYGEWLRENGNTSATTTKVFGGKFNREVFNQAFTDELHRQNRGGTSSTIVRHPEAMAIVSSYGTELGGGRPDDYTAPMDKRSQYTDLRNAYTIDSTISDKVSNINVEVRSYDGYRSSRDKAPTPLTDYEHTQMHESEHALKNRELQRQRRKVEDDIAQNTYFERLKQRVIMNK